MADVLEFDLALQLTSVEMTCGHIVFVTKRFDTLRRKDEEPFYCTICGNPNSFTTPRAAPPPEPPRKTVGEKIVNLFKSNAGSAGASHE